MPIRDTGEDDVAVGDVVQQLANVPVGAGGGCRPLIGLNLVDQALDGRECAVAVGHDWRDLAHTSMVAEIDEFVPPAIRRLELRQGG